MDLSARFLALTLTGAGWVLWLLVALSVVSVAVMIERLWYLKTHGPDKATLAADMRVLLADGPVADGLDGDGAGAGALDPERLAAAVDGAKARMKLRLERRLAFLATLGSNAPFIGLFGTVLGIIRSFADLSHSQGTAGGGMSVVISGIAEALVATALGLLVAIPAVVAFNYFQGKIRRILGRVDVAAQAVLVALPPVGVDTARKG